MNLLERLSHRQLLVVTGKGGVGKSTISAALGRILCAAGRRVLLLEVDPRESLYRLLGVPPSGGSFVQVQPGLFVQNLQPMEVLNQVVREHLRVDFLIRRVLSSPVYRHFAEGAPGLKEIAVLGHALRVVRGLSRDGSPEIDAVVLDAPATGHGVSMLAAPSLVSEVIREGPLGHMGGELAEFIADQEKCGILVTTLAEEMPVQEAVELIHSLRERLARSPELMLVNGLYPPLGNPVTQEAAESPDSTLSLWLDRRGVNERQLKRLRSAWTGPLIELPLLPREPGPELLAALEEPLERALVEGPWD